MIPINHKKFIDNSIKILKDDFRIVGIATGGSYITNEMDEYSDIDFIIAVDSNHYEEVMDERYKNSSKSRYIAISVYRRTRWRTTTFDMFIWSRITTCWFKIRINR